MSRLKIKSDNGWFAATSNRIPAATIGNPHTRIKKKEL